MLRGVLFATLFMRTVAKIGSVTLEFAKGAAGEIAPSFRTDAVHVYTSPTP